MAESQVEKSVQIHPLLLEANRLLLILNNQRITSDEAIALWSLIEGFDPVFAGIGNITLNMTISSVNAKLWAKRALYFWCLFGAEGGAGITKPPLIPVEKENDGSESLLIEDFWCRIYSLCTCFDRSRQLRFVFHQLVLSDPATINRLGFGYVHKNQLKNLVSVMHGEVNGPREMEKMLSYVTLDDNNCVDFSAFTRLNVICKSLIQPLDAMRRMLRKQWLGEHFWRIHDKRREAMESQRLKDISELLRSGEFLSEHLTMPEEEEGTKKLSLKSIREALVAKQKKEKKEAAVVPEVLVPVGERVGVWWREEAPIKIRKKNKKKPTFDPSKVIVEKETADVLTTIPKSQKHAKAVLKAAKAALKLAREVTD